MNTTFEIGTGEARREPQRAGEVRPRARHDADHAPAPARRRGGLRRRLVGGEVRGRRGTLAELGREAPSDAATFLSGNMRRGRRPTRRRGRRLVRRRGGGIIFIPVAARFEGRTRESFRGRRWVRTRRRRALARADVRSLLVRVRRLRRVAPDRQPPACARGMLRRTRKFKLAVTAKSDLPDA